MTGSGRPRPRKPPVGRAPDAAGSASRRLAVDVLDRIDQGGAYANLALRAALDRSGLPDRDRAMVTDLVYGATRMRRACDHLVDRHLRGGVSPRVRNVLRLGAHQLAFTDVAAHAAVHATVAAAPKPARGLVNAVLRRVAADVEAGIDWPDRATAWSMPDWIVATLESRLGDEAAAAAIESMNLPATVHLRPDGYVQDPASQRVVELVAAAPGELVLDLCAAPGGKATALAGTGARVVAADLSPVRAGLITANAGRVEADVSVLVSDARQVPLRPAVFDRVLVDAPCSGLGVLRRRADARWRIDADAPTRLADIQAAMLDEAARLVAPGGRLVFSVCTLTEAENRGVTGPWTARSGWELEFEETIVPDPARDGMYVAGWRAPAA